jgi:hypothetical protein
MRNTGSAVVPNVVGMMQAAATTAIKWGQAGGRKCDDAG